MSSRRWLILIVAAGALLRLFPIWFGLPYGLARPDEEVSTRVAARMLTGDFNPRFFHWPSFTFDLFAALYALAGVPRRVLTGNSGLTYAEQVLIGRAAVACAGTATLVVLFRLGRRVADETTGLIAAALLAVAVLHVRESHFAMTDVLMTFWVTASLSLLLRAVDESERPSALTWYTAAGLSGGLATSTKYNAAAVVAAMAAAQLLVFWRSPRAIVSPRAWLPSVVFSLALLAGFLSATPYALLDHGDFRLGLRQVSEHLSEGHGVHLGRGWIYHVKYSLPFGIGITAFAAAIAGIVPLARRYPRHGFVLGSFVVAVYSIIGSGYAVFFRYILPIVPILCLAAAVAVRRGAAWLASRAEVSHRATLAALLFLTVGPGLVSSAWLDALLARTDTRVIAGRWLVERLRPDDTLYDGGGIYVGLDLDRARFRQRYFDHASESFGTQEHTTPDWLVLHDSPLFLYAKNPFPVQELARRNYVLSYTVRATRGRARSAIYDHHDAFFMPMWGFWTVERPGPTIRIYRRKDLP